MRYRFSLLLTLALILASSADSRADKMIEFSLSSASVVPPPTDMGTGLPNYTALPNSTVDVHVFVTEMAPQDDFTMFGLISGGVRLEYDSSAGSAFVNASGDITEGGQWNKTKDEIDNALSPMNNFAQVLVDALGLNQPPATGTEIHVATFTFMTGPSANVTKLTALMPVDNVFDEIFLLNDSPPNMTFTVVDADVFDPIQMAQITTVPEPASFLFLALVGMITGAGYFVRGKLRAKHSA